MQKGIIMVNPNLPAPQPAPAFGAVMGKNDYTRLIYVACIWAVVFALTVVAYHVPSFLNEFDAERQVSVAGFALTFTVVGGLALLVYAHEVFTHADEIFKQDVSAGRDAYAADEFRTWLNQRYGVEFTAAAAVQLVRGRSASVNRTTADGRTERIKVYLDGIAPLANIVGIDSVGEVPDLSTLHNDIDMMIIEEPAKPHVYVWV